MLAGNLLSSVGERDALYAQLSVQKTLLIKNFSKKSIDLTDYGRALTPLHYEGSEIRRYYQIGSRCYQLSVLPGHNELRKVVCRDFKKYLFPVGREDLEVSSIGEVISSIKGRVTVDGNRSRHLLQGLVHSQSMIEQDRLVFGRSNLPHPVQDLEVLVQSSTTLVAEDRTLKIEQASRIWVQGISVLEHRNEEFINEINITNDDLIFKQGAHRVIIYKDWIRKPFDERFTVTNKSFIQMLDNLSQESKSGPVCYRDTCHELVFQGRPVLSKRFYLIEIDLLSHTIRAE